MGATHLRGWVLSFLIGALLVGGALHGVALYHQAQGRARTQLSQDLYLRAVLAQALLDEWLTQQPESLATPAEAADLARRLARPAQARVAFHDANGRLIADSRDGVPARGNEEQLSLTSLLAGAPALVQERSSLTATTLQVTVARRQAQALVGTLSLMAPLPGRLDLIGSVVADLWLPGLLLVGLCLLLASLMANRLHRKLRMIETVLRGWHLTPTEPQELPVETLAELSDIHQAYNASAQRLADQLIGLQRETQQWSALFTSLREGLFSIDEEYRVLTMNLGACRMLGVNSSESLAGRPLLDLTRNANLNDYLRSLLGGESGALEQELDLPLESGRSATYLLSGVRFTLGLGKQRAALVLMKDMSRLKHLENMRKEFVANVSHELKTPITSIKGYTEMAISGLDDKPADVARFLAIVERQADRLNAIVDDLLYLSRLEQGDESMVEGATVQDLRLTVNQAAQICAARAIENQVRVLVELPALPLLANHRLLENALINLLDNGIKYSPAGTTVQVTAEQDAQTIRLQVRDQGRGIPAEHLDRIFERFYRVDKSRDRRSGGTGLGLSIVKHIMRVHGGQVLVQSTVGKGSTFTLVLPRQAGASN
jgi:two-component system, OmpR family, phosphate regulon sensor histidine kinase PhoR